MNLADVYRLEGRRGLNALAKKAGCNGKYLYQCATALRSPSPRLAKRLISVDPRLSLDAIYLGEAA